MFELNDEEQQTVADLTAILAAPPVLALPRPVGQLVIKTDARDR